MDSKPFVLGAFLIFSATLHAQLLPQAIPIWPDSVGPGSEKLQIKQTITHRTVTGTCTIDRAIEKVTIPSLVPFIPSISNGTGVLLFPGGGYQRLSVDIEGSDMALWFNKQGITAFVLTYRLPIDDHVDKAHVPLQDAQRAMRYVKHHAASWGLDSSKIGVLGASAGGHLASSLSTDFNKQVYLPMDALDKVSARPSFQILLYPVISMDSSMAHAGSRTRLIGSSPSQEKIKEFSPEKQVKRNTPPTFIALAQDDPVVQPVNSQCFHDSLLAHHIKTELHVYKNGGHGKGICKAAGTDFAHWVEACEAWLKPK
jgi:acetyl esterase/lipase